MTRFRSAMAAFASVMALLILVVSIPILSQAQSYNPDDYTKKVFISRGVPTTLICSPEVTFTEEEKARIGEMGFFYSPYENTLIIDSVNLPTVDLYVQNMGEDFKIDLRGTNTLNDLSVWALTENSYVEISTKRHENGVLNTAGARIIMQSGNIGKIRITNPANVTVDTGINPEISDENAIHLISDMQFSPDGVFSFEGDVDKPLVFHRDNNSDPSDVIFRSAGDSYSFSPQDAVVYLDPNGGYWRSDNSTKPRTITAKMGSLKHLDASMEMPVTKEHQVFTGWMKTKVSPYEHDGYEKGECSGVYYVEPEESETILYAEWQDIPEDKLIVVFDGCGGITYTGKGGSQIVEKRLDNIEKGKAFKDNDWIEPFYAENWDAPEGKVFAGWYKDKEYTSKFNETDIMEQDLILYAKWADSKDVSPDPEPEKKLNGLVKGQDDKWALYKNGIVDTSVTSIVKNDYGWWRVENGYVNFGAQGIYKNNYGWWKTTNGKVTFNETGVFKNDYGWWRVEGSKVNFNANGVYKNNYGWWKTQKGKVDFSFTGIAKNEYGTWYVKNGKVDFSKNGVVSYNGKAYQIEKGKVV